VLIASLLLAQQTPPLTPDIPAKFDAPTSAYDYVKRDVMIPMRDGVKLHTVIVVPKGARSAPILLTRTPYNASARAQRNASPHMMAALPLFDEPFAADGYIRVYQDVRGKYGSESEPHAISGLLGRVDWSRRQNFGYEYGRAGSGQTDHNTVFHTNSHR